MDELDVLKNQVSKGIALTPNEGKRLIAEVAELRVRAEAAEAWCASWKRGAGISSRERDEARARAADLERQLALPGVCQGCGDLAVLHRHA